MIFGILLAVFAAAGLVTDGWNGSKDARSKIHADVKGARAEFEREARSDRELYPYIGKLPREISHER